MKLLSLLEASAEMAVTGHRINAAGEHAIAMACRMVAAEAKRVLGTYDYGWKSLKSSTVARKGKDSPGLSTGELRNSIQWTAKGLEGCVGTNNVKGVWFELGTMHQPPRSFLAGALRARARAIQKVVGQSMADAMRPHQTPGMYVLHGLEKIGHQVKEHAEIITEDDEQDHR